MNLSIISHSGKIKTKEENQNHSYLPKNLQTLRKTGIKKWLVGRWTK